jgi:hypothetical protein
MDTISVEGMGFENGSVAQRFCCSTNIEMLSPEQEARIEECFRDENRWLLNTYYTDTDADRIYQTYAAQGGRQIFRYG